MVDSHGDAVALHGQNPETGSHGRFRRAVVFIVAVSVPSSLPGQILDHFNPISQSAKGFHVYGATISTMYAGGAGLGMGTGISLFPGLPDGTRFTTIQASAAVGWSITTRKSTLLMRYSPSYVRGLRGIGFDSTNHAASLSFSRFLTKKWTIDASLSGSLSDLNQLPFGRTRYGNIVSTPATFNEFAALIMTARSGNIALDQAVNAPPLLGSPETAFLYGGRVLGAFAQISANYAYSSRSSFTASLHAVRTQSFESGSNLNRPGNNAFLPKTTSASANLGWNYSLSPRTTIGATVSASRIVSRFQDAYLKQAAFSTGRTITKQWFVQATAGVGWITPIRQTFQLPTRPQMMFGGSTGYKLYAHTFIARFDRFASDYYGIGANATETGSGVWSWRRPGTTISVTASFGYSRLISPALQNTRGWNGSVSAGKALNAHLAMSIGYSYMRFPTSIVTASPDLTFSGVMASLSWSPSERR